MEDVDVTRVVIVERRVLVVVVRRHSNDAQTSGKEGRLQDQSRHPNTHLGRIQRMCALRVLDGQILLLGT